LTTTITKTNNNSNNSNQNQQQLQQQPLEFINNKWELEEKCFTETLMPPVKEFNHETKRTKIVRKPYPRIRPVEQRAYESFYSRIIDPQTGKPYEQRGPDGSIIKQPDNLGPVRHYVWTVIRQKGYDGNEYLLTLGNLYGFNSFGDLVSYYVHKPESYNKTLFDTQRRYDQKSERLIEVTTSPISQQEIFTLPFNEENLNFLVSNKTINKTTPLIYRLKNNRRGNITISKPCSFVVKETTGEARIIEGSSFEEKLQLFKTAPFDYLFKFEYLDQNDKSKSEESKKV
jgi:hypothetical protein